MKRPLLVTVSGMVGTGKTTAIKQLVDVMQREGIDCAQWRFQRLPCITLRPTRPESQNGKEPSRNPTKRRGVGYQSRRLTAILLLGHLVRIIAFRVFHRWPSVHTAAISDRYFYDSLAHYELGTRRERFYTAILRRMMPKPDVAFLMVASPQTIAMRRPQYSTDYLRNLSQGYERVLRLFPELIEITSEPQHKGLEQIGVILGEALASRAHTLRRTNNHPAGTAAAS